MQIKLCCRKFLQASALTEEKEKKHKFCLFYTCKYVRWTVCSKSAERRTHIWCLRLTQEREEFFKLYNLSIYIQTTRGRRQCYETTLQFSPEFLFVVADEEIYNIQNVLYEFESPPTKKQKQILDLFTYAYLSGLKFSLLR